MTVILLALLLVLGTGLAGYLQWRRGVAERDALVQRTALDVEASSERRGRRLDRWLRRTRPGRYLGIRLERAGLRWRIVDTALGLAAIGAGSFLVAAQFVSWWIAVVAGAGLARLALNYLSLKESQRREAFIGQLPDLARLLSNATSAGLALRSAIRMASEDLGEPARTELHHLSDRLDLGISMPEALSTMHDRLPSRELSLLTRTLIIQSRAGGTVVTALREMSLTLEARKDLRREVTTMLAGSVFTSWIVLILGVGSVLVLNLIIPGTLHRITTSLIGQLVLAISGGLYALGFVLIRRTTRIEV